MTGHPSPPRDEKSWSPPKTRETPLRYFHGKRSRFFLSFLLSFFTLAFSYRTLEHITSDRDRFRELYEAGIFKVFLPVNYSQVALQSFYDTAFLLFLILAVSHFPDFWNRLHEAFLGIKERTYLSVIFIFSLLYSVGEFYKTRFIPLRGDDFAFLFQAKLLALGKLFVPSHPLQKFFQTDYLLHHAGKTYAEYTLGTSFFLMFGELFGAPWLVNPLLGAVCLIIIFYLLKDLLDEEIARYGIIAIAASPYFLLGTASYLSHAPSLFCLSLFFLFLLKARAKKHYYISAGLLIGFGLHIRILTAVSLAGIALAWRLGEVLGEAKSHERRRAYLVDQLVFPGLYLVIGFILPFALLFLINYLQNGQPFLFGQKLYNGPRKTIGFSAEYPVEEALLAVVFRLKLIISDLFSLKRLPPFSIFGLVSALLLLRNKSRYLLFSALIWIIITYFPVSSAYSQPRYYYIPIVYIIPLIGAGFDRFVLYLKEKNYLLNRFPGTALPLFTLIILLYSTGNFSFKPYPYYRAFTLPGRIIQRNGLHHAVVFIGKIRTFYPRWYIRNSPYFDDDILFALDLGKENQELIDYYPDRSFYILNDKRLAPYPANRTEEK